MGSVDGSIIATIMATHISAKERPAPMRDSPRIGIHIMDIVHPPGMAISPDIERANW